MVISMDEPQADKTQRRELIAFRIGAQEFCVDIMSVREIRGFTPATVLPRAPSFVRGVINLRGAVLPIVDLAARLGFPATDPTVRHVIMVVQVERQVVGLLVDAVLDILTVANRTFSRPRMSPPKWRVRSRAAFWPSTGA